MSDSWLVIDLGNSRLKWAVADRAGLRAEPCGSATWPGGDLPWTSWAALDLAGVALAGVAAADTVAELAAVLERRLRLPVRQPAVLARWQGLICAYGQPGQLGVDRWLALIAAYQRRAATPLLLASAGTALTIDRLQPDGRHVGGLIAPGLGAMRAGLVAAAPGLARHTGGRPGPGLAVASPDAIASGCLQAALALIERCRAAGPGAPPWPLVLTGGDAAALRPHLGGVVHECPRLVLDGLACWAFTRADAPA